MVSLEYQKKNSHASFQFCVISPYTSMYNETISISSLIYMILGFVFFFFLVLMNGQFNFYHNLLPMQVEIISQVYLTYICRLSRFSLQGMWVGVLHYVVGKHDQYLPYSEIGTSVSAHDPLSGEVRVGKVYLTKGGPAH